MARRLEIPTIRFDATLRDVGGRTIARLPKDASTGLPSRGQVAIRGTINGHDFRTVVEPDGDSGHWLRVDRTLQTGAAVKVDDTPTFEIQALKDWPEPDLPKDFETALAAAPVKIRYLWQDITPMARWEWVRWVNATRNPATRTHRIAVSISKMSSGKRRPCCFNLASCTDLYLSQNGRLTDGS